MAESLDIPAICVERTYPERDGSIRWCADYPDAIRRLEADGITRLLALTGVQTIAPLRPYWQGNECWFRILHREDSLEKALRQGFSPDHLVYYEESDTAALIARLHPQAILTKESGESGGFEEKVSAAASAGIPVYAIRRPEMPDGFVTVTGENGLRRAIEQLLPGFFALRTGFTTGACATAAAKAALLTLLGRRVGDSLPITFPNGEVLALPIVKSERGRCGAAGSFRQGACAAGGKGSDARGQHERSATDESAYAIVIKDAGDDPDVTNGRKIVDEPGIHFLQGEGVGRVTLPGLGIPVGEPAVNKVPREMITRELSALYDGGLDVTISVPGGRELALKTFNPKLGVVDGISIIGTSGIVRPFSSEAFVEALRKEMEVAIAIGVPQIVINSGAKSEQFLRVRFSDLQPQGFIHYGNFIGATLSLAAELGIRRVTMGIMLGKAVKLAEGNLDTHSKNVVMNREFLKKVAEEAGCSPATAAEIERLTLARELWYALQPTDLQRFLNAILARCRAACETVYPVSAGRLDILLLDEEGNVFESMA